jgi:hypothetical protein
VSTANLALAQFDPTHGEKLINAQLNTELRSRAARLGTSTSPQNTDTTWVGFTPGHQTGENYWSIYSGHGKDGYYRPSNGQPNKGLWDWEVPVHGDSLQGWWPIQTRYFGGVGTFGDRDHPVTTLDFGNQANYVINQANGRTFGVTGVWHVDAGSSVAPAGPAMAPNWAPATGAGAAWMGLRAHGDLNYQDPITKNYFNEDVLKYVTSGPVLAGGNDFGFPGYGQQMDQMLYRDIDFQGKKTSNLTVTFKYRTVMANLAESTPATMTGWYDGDPLGDVSGSSNPQLNNFISASDAGAGNAPRDSFMVYIGAGVDGNQWLASDGVLRNVYDPQRRWFAEVLHWDRDPGSNPLNPQPLYYKELLSVAGDNPADAGTNPSSYATGSFTITNAALAPYLAKNNKIRLVFRVKTNRNSDDMDDLYSSNRAGAAVVDDVTYQIGANPAVSFGTFNSASDINNSNAVSALDAWKSTGKPPAIYHHVHLFGSLTYADICGQKGDAGRLCDMTGNVISSGDHDRNEATNGIIGTASFDRTDGFISPVIKLTGPFTGPGGVNTIGLKAAGAGTGDIVADEDYYVAYDIYTGVFNPPQTGNYWDFAAMSFPARAKASHGAYDAWGQIKTFAFIIFNPDIQCLPDIEPLGSGGVLDTTSPDGIPDSVQVYLGKFTRCFRLGLSTNCGRNNSSPTGGAYFDNATFCIIDGIPSQINVDIWQWIQDAFPANESAGFPGNKALFDTTSALIKTGLNNAQIVGNKNRRNIPGDSVWVNSSSTTARMDMVFRVLPGPGNYQPIGQGHSGNLRRVPSNAATVTVNDGSWWDVLRRIPGEFSSNPAGMTNLKAGWNTDFWISARMDTAEQNLYAFQGRGVVGGPVENTDFMSTWHESDARYNLLGIDHFICFVRCSTCATNDIICNGTVPTINNPGGYLPLGTASITKEGSKIIRDGLLTPGAHVQYFFRDQKDSEVPNLANFALLPDTTTVSPQSFEGSTDGHRWQNFSILPDRWKDPQYVHPVFQNNGRGPACLLVVDNNDRRGNERLWISVADTIGASHPEKVGAHNGWGRANGNSNQGEGIGVNDPAYRVARHGGQPGTTFDFYNVKASESATTGGAQGSRL